MKLPSQQVSHFLDHELRMQLQSSIDSAIQEFTLGALTGKLVHDLLLGLPGSFSRRPQVQSSKVGL